MKSRAALLFTWVACGNALAQPGFDAGTFEPGFWKSEGYGLVFVADGDTLQTYEVTQTTCVPSSVMTRRADTESGIAAVYLEDRSVVQIKATLDPDKKRLHREGTASDIVIHRIQRLPDVCSKPTPDTPEGNFEVFAQTWSEHYILFDAKGADWPAVVAEARATVKPATTPEELFAIFQDMIAPFEDVHTFIAAPSIQRVFSGMRRGTDRLVKNGFADFEANVLPGLLAATDGKLQGPIRKWCNDKVQYGQVDDATGYLRILAESGYTDEGDFASGLVAFEEVLDTIFSNPELERLVIDVRVNFGGADPYGLELASRLATAEYVAYSKEARLDPIDRTKWTKGQPSWVRPSTKPGFKGPVVMLIGPLTISAGETTTQALMGRMPKVIRIGENTQGVFSDVLSRKLPNGWTFGLPNEVFRTEDGTTFDGPGIPPDITVPVFAEDDLAASRDPVLERALIELDREKQ